MKNLKDYTVHWLINPKTSENFGPFNYLSHKEFIVGLKPNPKSDIDPNYTPPRLIFQIDQNNYQMKTCTFLPIKFIARTEANVKLQTKLYI